jgi:hypothetical protein
MSEHPDKTLGAPRRAWGSSGNLPVKPVETFAKPAKFADCRRGGVTLCRSRRNPGAPEHSSNGMGPGSLAHRRQRADDSRIPRRRGRAVRLRVRMHRRLEMASCGGAMPLDRTASGVGDDGRPIRLLRDRRRHETPSVLFGKAQRMTTLPHISQGLPHPMPSTLITGPLAVVARTEDDLRSVRRTCPTPACSMTNSSDGARRIRRGPRGDADLDARRTMVGDRAGHSFCAGRQSAQASPGRLAQPGSSPPPLSVAQGVARGPGVITGDRVHAVNNISPTRCSRDPLTADHYPPTFSDVPGRTNSRARRAIRRSPGLSIHVDDAIALAVDDSGWTRALAATPDQARSSPDNTALPPQPKPGRSGDPSQSRPSESVAALNFWYWRTALAASPTGCHSVVNRVLASDTFVSAGRSSRGGRLRRGH